MCRVTVVDDEPALLEIVCLLLRDEGHDVLGIAHPDAVLGLPPGLQPDVFLIDLMLPGMTGVTLAKELRMQGFADTPMIGISASSSMLRQAIMSGLFDDTLRKPFELDELVACVDRHVDGSVQA